MTTPGEVPRDSGTESEQFWHDYLVNYSRAQAAARPILSRIPSSPRCQLCGSPFHGFGGRVMRVIGKAQSVSNPRMCNACESVLVKHHGGAEVPGTLLFADIRGSTALGERLTPREFHDLLDRFTTVASATVFAHNGMVDKFVGDELVAVFPPMLGEDHAKRAVDTALDLLRATGHADPDGPWVPVGAGVHTGMAWFGAVGEGDHVEITILGDVVNTAARIAAQAGAGEILVTAEVVDEAGITGRFDHRVLELKGKQGTTEVSVLHL